MTLSKGTHKTMASIVNNVMARLAIGILIVIGVPAGTGLLTWNLLNTINIQERLGPIEEKVRDLSIDRYHGADATRDLQLRDAGIDRNRRDIDKLDGRVSYLERKIK